jgi:hypothetical protein
MRPLQIEDVAELVVVFGTVKSRVLALLGSAELDRDAERGLVTAITSALRTLQEASPGWQEPPTLRRLEGALLQLFSGIDSEDRRETPILARVYRCGSPDGI